MALAQDIENKSIKEALRFLAEAIDKAQPQDLSALVTSINELKATVRALDISINGIQEASDTDPAPPVPTPAPVL